MSHVETTPHELRANILFDGHDDRPYWAFRKLMSTLDGDFQHEVKVAGETWHVSLGFDVSGVAPRPEDSVAKLYEYTLSAQGDGHRSLSARLQPRFETMTKYSPSEERIERDEHGDRVEIQGVPDDLEEAVNWRINPAVNIEPDGIPSLLARLVKAVADAVGHRWDPAFFTEQPHRYSSIWEYERYVRIRRDAGHKLIDSSGTFSRIRELLADQEGTKMELSIDNTGKNTDIHGYNHQYRLNEQAANQLIPAGHQRGKQLKHYHPEYVNSDEENPLYHPKFGVLFKKSWSRSAVPWRELDELTHELEETLVNVLSWSGLPVKPGAPTFVGDDHFNGSAESERDIGWYDDPTPEIETRQDARFVQQFGELTDGDEALLRQLVADGGTAKYDELAVEADTSVSTLYRALEKLDGLIDSEHGTVSFISAYVRQQFEAVFDRVETAVSAGATAAARVLDMDPRRIEEQGAAFQRWLNEYAVDVVESDSEQVKLKIGTMLTRFKSKTDPTLQEVLNAGHKAWRRAGRQRAFFFEDVEVIAQVDGATETLRVGQVIEPG